ncbi:MAG: hypothetical protein PHC34_01420 [Candidatus Gastranaerophilales bacterium]|nr:hypothetical protein [Candidatus Gastranaerophilales bacterium]
MRKNLILYLIFSIIYFYSAPLCFADEINRVKFNAEKVDKSFLIGEVDKLILKKYIAVRLDISNKNDKDILLPDKIYYVYKGVKYKTPSSTLVYQKTKRHTVIRGFATTIAVFPLIFFIVGIPIIAGTVAYSSTSNGNLESNIKKNIFKSKHIFDDEYYSTYVFIPKKHRNAAEIIIKEVSFDEQTFDLRSPISESL